MGNIGESGGISAPVGKIVCLLDCIGMKFRMIVLGIFHNSSHEVPTSYGIGMPSTLRYLARAWYYFRIGYATYLTFVLGAVNTLIVVWYLAIQQAPAVQNLFGHFVPFAIATTLIGVPLSILFGWVHLKKSAAYTSEMDIGVEANPYYYKFPPGYTKEVVGPFYLELLIQMKRLLASQQLLDSEQQKRIEELEKKLQTLIDGGYVGSPRTRI